VWILDSASGLVEGARRPPGLASFRLEAHLRPTMEKPPPGRGEDAVEPGEETMESRSRLAEQPSPVLTQPTRGIGAPAFGVHPASVAEVSDRVDPAHDAVPGAS
jgi:hypothetical protein